jgi:hypothetical protein
MVHLAHGRPLPALATFVVRTIVPTVLGVGLTYRSYALLRSDGGDNFGAAIASLGLGVLAGGSGMIGVAPVRRGIPIRGSTGTTSPAGDRRSS